MDYTQINTVGLFITKLCSNIPELKLLRAKNFKLIIVNLSSGDQVKR